MSTIRDLVKELIREGYKITPRTIKHYIEIGLLPKPEKEGGYKEGVKLIYQDGDRVKQRLKKIYELKGKGYTLSDIKDALREREEESVVEKRAKELEKFIEKDGRFYYVEDKYPDYPKKGFPPLDKLSSILTLSEEDQRSLWRRGDVGEQRLARVQPITPEDCEEIESRKLVIPVTMHPSGLFYYQDSLQWAFEYISLNKEYGISWDTLEALYKQHTKNVDRFYYLPEPDGIRFNNNYIGWVRQSQLNRFGDYLTSFIGRMEKRFFKMGWRGASAYWDANYSALDEFISDFLNGKCAFFAMIEEEPGESCGGIYNIVVKI